VLENINYIETKLNYLNNWEVGNTVTTISQLTGNVIVNNFIRVMKYNLITVANE